MIAFLEVVVVEVLESLSAIEKQSWLLQRNRRRRKR